MIFHYYQFTNQLTKFKINISKCLKKNRHVFKKIVFDTHKKNKGK